ncbi:MAG: hypothetical protein WCZ66_12030 [Sphingomonadaceae bacterium]
MSTQALHEIEEELADLSYDADDYDMDLGDKLRGISRRIAVEVERIKLEKPA